MLSWLSGIRAFAAIIVIVYHLNQQLPLGGLSDEIYSAHNFIARLSMVVSVFFFLSGFFRSMSYWKVIDTPEKMPRFWSSLRDRFLRIAPAYYIAVILSILVTILIHGYSSLNPSAILAGFTFTTWISPDTLFPVILNWPLWFVSFDMIGWILTSIVMIGLFRMRKKYTIPYILIIVLITLGLHFIWIQLPWTETDIFPASYWFPIYNPFIFFLHFIFGIVTAGIVNHMKKVWITANKWFDIGFLTVLIIGTIFLWNIRENGDDFAYSIPQSPYYFPWIQILIAIGCWSLPFTRYIGKWLDNWFSLFTARLSYSLYLIHGIILALLLTYIFPLELSLTNWSMLVILTFSLSYLGAYLMNRYVEG